MKIEPPSAADVAAIEALLDEAFGDHRRERTAYRLRDGAKPLAGLSLIARDDGHVVGSLQCWSILLVEPSRRAHPLILLGPVAVAANRRGEGIGKTLIRSCIARAGNTPMLLIGDAPYYGRFGFTADQTRAWSLPGPVERDRLLARGAERLPRVAEVRQAVPLSRAA